MIARALEASKTIDYVRNSILLQQQQDLHQRGTVLAYIDLFGTNSMDVCKQEQFTCAVSPILDTCRHLLAATHPDPRISRTWVYAWSATIGVLPTRKVSIDVVPSDTYGLDHDTVQRLRTLSLVRFERAEQLHMLLAQVWTRHSREVHTLMLEATPLIPDVLAICAEYLAISK